MKVLHYDIVQYQWGTCWKPSYTLVLSDLLYKIQKYRMASFS